MNLTISREICYWLNLLQFTIQNKTLFVTEFLNNIVLRQNECKICHISRCKKHSSYKKKHLGKKDQRQLIRWKYMYMYKKQKQGT